MAARTAIRALILQVQASLLVRPAQRAMYAREGRTRPSQLMPPRIRDISAGWGTTALWVAMRTLLVLRGLITQFPGCPLSAIASLATATLTIISQDRMAVSHAGLLPSLTSVRRHAHVRDIDGSSKNRTENASARQAQSHREGTPEMTALSSTASSKRIGSVELTRSRTSEASAAELTTAPAHAQTEEALESVTLVSANAANRLT